MKAPRKKPTQGKESAAREARRWEMKQQKILSAASRLFWKKGYLGTSIDDIAESADVNKATIYYYFKNKSSVLNGVMAIPMEAMLDLADSISKSDLDATEKLKTLIESHIKWQISHIGVAGIGHVERKNLPPKLRRKYVNMRDRYESIFRKTLEEGMKKNEFCFIDAKLAGLFILGLVNSIVQWYKPNQDFTADQIALEAFNFVYKALKPEK